MHAQHKTPTLADAILTLPSSQSQRVLENGLQAFAATTHSSLWRYIKCAANLPAKGVRDVALRVRWMRRARGGGGSETERGNRGGRERGRRQGQRRRCCSYKAKRESQGQGEGAGGQNCYS